MLKRGKLNASELGRAVGVSHVTIGNYLVGQPPKSVHLASIAKHFSVSTDWLLGLVGEGMYDERGGIKPGFETALTLHDAPAEYLIDDVLAEVQTIKEAVAALERKLKKLKP